MSTKNTHEMTEEEMNNMDGGISALSVSADDNYPVYDYFHCLRKRKFIFALSVMDVR